MSNVVNIGEDSLIDGDEILVYDDGLGDFQILYSDTGDVLVYDGV